MIIMKFYNITKWPHKIITLAHNIMALELDIKMKPHHKMILPLHIMILLVNIRMWSLHIKMWPLRILPSYIMNNWPLGSYGVLYATLILLFLASKTLWSCNKCYDMRPRLMVCQMYWKPILKRIPMGRVN